MLRSIMVGLDGSDASAPALDLAIRWAKRFDALLVGIGCVDEPGLHGPEEYLVGEAFFDRLNADLLTEVRTRVEGTLSRAALRCGEAGVAFKPLEEVGRPFDQILEEAQRFDLIVLGRQTHFRFGWEETPDATLHLVLADSPRPVVTVPAPLAADGPVVVAFDGSLQASRALAAFEASGLGQQRPIHVLSIADAKRDAARKADRAVEFLKSHGLDASLHAVDTHESPGKVLLDTIRRLDAGLVVMGAYGQPVLKEFFLGSTTQLMLEECPAPLFLYH